MNIAEIQAQVYDDLGYKSSPDAAVVRRLLPVTVWGSTLAGTGQARADLETGRVERV